MNLDIFENLIDKVKENEFIQNFTKELEKNMENSMISEKPCAGPDVFSWGFSASDKDRFFADFSKNRKTVKKYHT